MNTEILMLAGQIREKTTAEVIEWGRRINAAEAAPNDEKLKVSAHLQGRLVASLASTLASKFG
jgi:hypothetical protein